MDNCADPHTVSFFKETLNFKVSPQKSVINNLGKKCANKIKYLAGQLFSKFHQNKLRNKRAGHHFRCSKSLKSNFSKKKKKKKFRDVPLVLKSDHFIPSD